MAFDVQTTRSFQEHLAETSNGRRVSKIDLIAIIEWLNESPTRQKEFSRRHYVRNTFHHDENTDTLLVQGNSQTESARLVVIEDDIAGVVEQAHINNNHAGWDRTWNDVKASFYGIPRADVIFLLNIFTHQA